MTKHDETDGPKNGDGDEIDDAARARRRLLKVGAYVVPVVIGTLMYSGDAKAQQGNPSCGPRGCTPPGNQDAGGGCTPDTNPCVPNN